MAITYSIEFAAQIARLEAGVKQGSQAVQRMASEMESAAGFARTALLGLASALGIGSFAAAIKGASEAADAAAKMGDRFGIATDMMIGMQHAGKLAGASNEALATALRSMARSGIDAARGGEEAAKAYGMLGIRAGEFVKLPMDRQFSIIIEKLGAVENVTLRNALAQEVLGKAAGEVMGLVAEGADSFARAAEDARDWGLAIDRVDAAKLEMANDAITRAQAAAQGLFTTIALHVAPAVKALADYFADSSKEAKGFKTQAADAAEVVITGIGYAANVVQGLRFAYVGVKLVLAELLRIAAEGFAWLAENAATFGAVLKYLPGPIGLAGRMMAGLVSRGAEDFRMFADAATESATVIRAELEALADEGLPKEKMIARIREIREVMQREAEQIAAARTKMMRGSPEEIERDKAPKEQAAIRDTWREQLAQKIERLREETMTELELLDERRREKNMLLQAAIEADLLTEAAGLEQSRQLRQKYEADRTKIEDEAIKRRFGIANVYRQLDLASASSFFGQLGAMMSSQHRTAFNIGKAAAISQTIIDTYRGAQGAFAALAGIPIVGPILGAAAAGAAIIAGMARVQAIRSQQFGAGGGATPVFAANPATGLSTAPIGPVTTAVEPPTQPAITQAQRRDVTITFIGSGRYTQEEIRESLWPALSEALGDGVSGANLVLNR